MTQGGYDRLRSEGYSNRDIESMDYVFPVKSNVFAMMWGKEKKEMREERPALTREIYLDERNNGLTFEQIKEKYDTNECTRQLGGWGRKYSLIQKEIEAEEQKPKLTYSIFANLKDQGLTDAQITQDYRLRDPESLKGMYQRYVKRKSKRTQSK